MKKIVGFVLLLGLACAGMPAAAARNIPIRNDSKEQLFQLSRQGDVKGLKRLFSREMQDRHYPQSGPFYYFIMQSTDEKGNNAFHVAADENTFQLLLSVAHGLRNELLSSKNRAGETPWMSYISYERADIFLKYFSTSDLYRRMRKIKSASNDKADRIMAEVEEAVLLEECSAGGQTMWRRADALWRQAPQGSVNKQKMGQIRRVLAKAAPFLVR